MITLAIILGFSVGWAFGLFGFFGDYDYDEETPFALLAFRVVTVAFIFFAVLLGGLFQTGVITENIDQGLGLIIAYGLGVFCNNELNETEIEFSLIDDWIAGFGRQNKGKKHKNAASVALIRLAAHFYRPYLSEMEITYSLKHLSRFRNWDSLDIQIIIAQHSAERVMPVSMIGNLGLSQSPKLKGIFADLLWIGAERNVLLVDVVKRLEMVATSAGLSKRAFEKLQGKYKIDPEQQRKGRQAYQAEYDNAQYSGDWQGSNQHHGQRRYTPNNSYVDEKTANLAKLGLSTGASLADLKKAFRKNAVKYHPDRNMNASPKERIRSAEKMTEVNLAYDWLKANW